MVDAQGPKSVWLWNYNVGINTDLASQRQYWDVAFPNLDASWWAAARGIHFKEYPSGNWGCVIMFGEDTNANRAEANKCLRAMRLAEAQYGQHLVQVSR